MVFFILGSHPELSAAEIEAVVGKLGQRVGDIFLIEDVDQPFSYLQNRLAGTVKIGRIVGSFKRWNKEEAAELIASQIRISKSEIRNKSEARSSKTNFGISAYGKGVRHQAQPLGLAVKKLLKADGISARLVTSKEPELSSVVVAKNKLLGSGGEFVMFEHGGEILIGVTETVQDFEAWGERDFGRPARDPKSGMLPPKLARMMINLSGVDPFKSVLLDSFCGSGTVLMEALLMGFKAIIGSDISEKAIADTKKNLQWLIDVGAIHESPKDPRVIRELPLQVIDATKLKLPHLVDVVVTEPYLGPPQRGGENLDQIIAELTGLYQKSFQNIHRLMRPGAPLVVAFPVFVGGKTISKPLPGFEPKERFRYERQGQRVARDILVFKRV